jgi:hypothetical protein
MIMKMDNAFLAEVREEQRAERARAMEAANTAAPKGRRRG